MNCPECGCQVQEENREISWPETDEEYADTVTWVDLVCPCCGWSDDRIED